MELDQLVDVLVSLLQNVSNSLYLFDILFYEIDCFLVHAITIISPCAMEVKREVNELEKQFALLSSMLTYCVHDYTSVLLEIFWM